VSLVKESIIDKIEVVGNTVKSVGVRTSNVIFEDGIEVSRTYARTSIDCDHDYSNQDPLVISICDLVFTDEMRQEHERIYQESIAPISGD
jgi:hypothetical protein